MRRAPGGPARPLPTPGAPGYPQGIALRPPAARTSWSVRRGIIMANRWALALTLGAGLAATAADAPPGPPPATERLIEQLGSPDYKSRAAATRMLEARGEPALPALRQAQNHPDLEVRQRLTALIAALERAALLAPKRVTLHVEQRPLPEAMAELAKQTGYRLDLQGGRQRSLVTLPADNA